MINGMIGRKLGMGQMFDDSGRAIGVTVVEVGPCFVVRKKVTRQFRWDMARPKKIEFPNP